MTALPLLDLSGDAHQRGHRHGSFARDMIAANIRTYLRRFTFTGASEARIMEEGARWAERIKTYDPVYHAEMAALAEAAGQPLGAIGMLNARYELAYTAFSTEAEFVAAQPDGCTSFGIMPEAAASGHTLIGQNWDWLAALTGNLLMLRVRRDDAPDFLTLTQAGIVCGMAGVNEAGIGMTVNGLISEREGRISNAKPFHLRCAEIMNARRLDHALGAILQTDRVCSVNMVMGQDEGDGAGEIVDIEAAPDRAAYIYPREGVVTHANHFEASPWAVSQIERLSASTVYRTERLRRHLARHRGQIDLETIKTGLRDHFSHPGSICTHPDDAFPEEVRVATVSSFIIDLTERCIYATAGTPCTHEYTRYALA